MGNILIIKNADFENVAVSKVTLMSDNYVKISVKSSNAAGGSVTGTGFYEIGSQVQISATPNSNYTFIKWSDGNTNQQRTIIVGDTDQTYTAIFRFDSLFTMHNYALVAGGAINLTQPDDHPYRKYTSEQIYYSENGATVSYNYQYASVLNICTIVVAASLDTGTWDNASAPSNSFVIPANSYIRAYINIGSSRSTDEEAQTIMEPVNFALASGDLTLVTN